MQPVKKSPVRSATVGWRFRESGKLGEVEWADSVDPAHKCGYAYLWLPDEEGNLPPHTKNFAPGEEVLVRRYLAVGTSPNKHTEGQ